MTTFLPVAQLLDAEVAVAEAAGHEVAAGHRLLDGHFVVERGGFRGHVAQVDRAGRAGRLGRLIGHQPGRQGEENGDRGVEGRASHAGVVI